MADLSVFLPRTLYGLMAPALEGREAFKAVRGTVLFCDIAGFTPLTEALSVIGREGAEELTRLINAYFSAMIGIVEEEGGDVLRFGGDSMTLLFPGEAQAQALRAAERMMAAMAAFEAVQTRAGVFGLSIKVGASCGELLLGLVGGEQEGFDYYAAGPPLDESAEAEHQAPPGWIVGRRAFLSGALDGVESEPLPDGFLRLRSAGEAPPLVTARTPAPARDLLQRFIPRHLAERAGEGVLGEHRGTAVLFLTFSGVPIETGEKAALSTHRKLDGLYKLFVSTARRYGGLVNKLDMGDKGCKALFLFGSPYAIENREEMAVRAAQELLSKTERPSEVKLRIGITSAPLFSGPVGSDRRREFTVIGDGINLAARLMQAASEGQALCDAAVAAKTSASIKFAALAPIQLKGRREPLPVFTPVGEADEEKAGSQILVGRDEACETLRRYLAGESSAPVCLAGDPGTGKTALIEWGVSQARTLGLPVVRVPLRPYSQERPYSAWRGVVRSLLGLGRDDTPERARAARDEALSKEPSGFRPLLNVFLDLPEEITPALRNLSAKEKLDLTHSILGRLLGRAGKRAILLDGVQWADPLSLDLLAFLLEDPEPVPWRLVAAFRPGGAEAERASAKMLRVDLPPLVKADVQAVLKRAHGLTEVQPSILEWFALRTHGNPAVLSALFAALNSAGLVQRFESVVRVDSDRLFATFFPETLEGLYLARVDPLPRLERETLQHAAILGASVSVNLLGQITGMEERDLKEALLHLEATGFLRSDSWGSRPYYRFVDPLLQEAVYGSLPYALKRSGHLKLAQFLEPGAEKAPKLWPTLAHHYEQADEKEKARTYHRMAGRAAAKRYDNVTALKHLEYVCALPERGPEDVEDAFTLMDAYGFLGRWSDAKEILERLAHEELRLTLPHQARLQNYLARELASHGEWEGTEAVLHKGIALAQKAEDVLLEAKGYVNLAGRVYGPTGQLDKARLVLEKALGLPEGPGQKIVRTTAAMNLGSVFHHLGKLGSAKVAFYQAYREASKAKLGPQQGMIANNLCYVLYEGGDFSESAKWALRSSRILETYAARALVQSAKYNLALARLALGQAQETESLLAEVYSQAQAYGYMQVQAQARQGLSQALALLGDISVSTEHTKEALSLFRHLKNGRDYRFKLLDMGELFYSLGAPEAARRYWEENGVLSFLQETPPDPVADKGLSRIDAWIAGDKTWQEDLEAFVKEAQGSSSEERVNRLLWASESIVERESLDVIGWPMKPLDEALASRPYFVGRLRTLRLKALSAGGLKLEQRREAKKLLSRCTGGVWGVRLLCLLCDQEKRGPSASRLKKKAVERLGFIKAHSPNWAWEKIAAFPEVKAVLLGSKT